MSREQPVTRAWTTRDRNRRQPVTRAWTTHDRNRRQPVTHEWTTRDRNRRQPVTYAWTTRDRNRRQPVTHAWTTCDMNRRQPVAHTWTACDMNRGQPVTHTWTTRDRNRGQRLIHIGATRDMNSGTHMNNTWHKHKRRLMSAAHRDKTKQNKKDIKKGQPVPGSWKKHDITRRQRMIHTWATRDMNNQWHIQEKSTWHKQKTTNSKDNTGTGDINRERLVTDCGNIWLGDKEWRTKRTVSDTNRGRTTTSINRRQGVT